MTDESYLRAKVKTAYSYHTAMLESKLESGAISNNLQETSTPRHLLSFQTLFNPKPNIDLDLWLRYVDEVTASTEIYGTKINDPYWNLDLRLFWRSSDKLELTLLGKNLLESSHAEGFAEAYDAHDTKVERGAYVQMHYRF